MNNHMGLKKVCTRWVPKLLTPMQCINRVDCCQELLKQSEVNPAKFSDCIVTGDEFWTHHYDFLSQLEVKIWKRSDEQTPTRLHQERLAGKIMIIIFWDKDDVLLTEYLPRGTTINGPCYASIIERLHSIIVEKGRGKVSHGVLLLHDSAPIDKYKIVQAAFRQAGLNELNHPVCSRDIALITIHSQTWRNLFFWGILAPMKKQSPLLRTIWLILIQSFFVKAYKVCMAAGSVWLLVKVSTFNKYDNYLSIV